MKDCDFLNKKLLALVGSIQDYGVKRIVLIDGWLELVSVNPVDL
ncbi:MAG: hypothetical protein RIB71_07395 [Imperialibacter sp.]